MTFIFYCIAQFTMNCVSSTSAHSIAPQNEISFNSMLQIEDSNMITGLSLYIYHSLQRRKTHFGALKKLCNIMLTMCTYCIFVLGLYSFLYGP